MATILARDFSYILYGTGGAHSAFEWPRSNQSGSRLRLRLCGARQRRTRGRRCWHLSARQCRRFGNLVLRYREIDERSFIREMD